jgi:hypothetical protein
VSTKRQYHTYEADASFVGQHLYVERIGALVAASQCIEQVAWCSFVVMVTCLNPVLAPVTLGLFLGI